MTKSPTPAKKNYSSPDQWLLGRQGNLLEIRANHLLLLGPGGLWVGVWVENSNGSAIETSRSWLEKADVDKGLVEYKSDNDFRTRFYCGDIRSWRGSKQRELSYVRRRHPELTRANYSYVDRQVAMRSYRSEKYQVVMIQDRNLGRLSINFTGPKTPAQSIWVSAHATKSYARAFGNYLISQVLLPDTSWQDPRSWLAFISRHSAELTVDFKQNVYKKLIRQFNSDAQEDGAVDIQPRLLRKARLGWWSAHPGDIQQILGGLKHTERAQAVTKSLRDFASKYAKDNVAPEIDLPWFSNFLPLANKGVKQNFVGLPLNIAEYALFLHNNLIEEETHDN